MPAIKDLKPHFPNGDPTVDRELAKLLVKWGDPNAVGHCLELLAAAETGGDRLYYLHVLSGATKGWNLRSREAFFAAIRHPNYFPGDRNMPAFLKGIRERAIATLSDAEKVALGDKIHPAAAIAEAKPPTPQPTVGNWSVDDLLAAHAPEKVNPEIGYSLFERALCSRCHQLSGRGTPLGPDLTHAGARFSKRDLIEAIVNPSAAVAEIFRHVAITKKDGAVLVGRIVRDDFRKSTLSLSPNPFTPEELVVVSKHDIAEQVISPASPMPPGLLNTLTLEEASVLIEFILSGGAGD
jgi:putative heme-binding domain-containing protein